MRRKELIDHFREMTPGELIESYFEAQLNTPRKHRTIEINEGIDICTRSLEIAIDHVLKMEGHRLQSEIQGGLFI